MSVARIGGPDGDVLSREISRSMPIVHAKATKAPLLLIYSPSDRVTRPGEVLAYAKAVGKSAKPVPVRCDGHGEVPDAGFKLAAMWLRAQCKRNRDTAAVNLVSGSAKESVVDTDNAVDASPTAESEPVNEESLATGEQQPSEDQQEVKEVRPSSRPSVPAPRSRQSSPKPLPTGVQRNPYFD